MDDQDRRIRELKWSVDRVGDLVQWSAEMLRTTVTDSREPKLTPLASIVDYVKDSSESFNTMELDLRSYLGKQDSDVTAIAKSTSVIVDTVKSAIKSDQENDALLSDMARKTELVTSRPVVETITRSESRSGMSYDLQKKLGNVLDSASGFFESWGSPVSVGAALSLPIVGGLGVIFGGVVLTIDKLVDGITSIVGKVTDLPSGVAGALGGAISGIFSSSRNSSSIDSNALNATILLGTRPIVDKLSNIDGSIKNIKFDNASFAVNFDPIIKAINSATTSISTALNTLPTRNTADSVIVTQNQDDFAYRARVISLLENPVPVEVIVRDNIRTSSGENQREDVFSNAVRPLVRNQEAMYSMLSSSLRELKVAVASLSVPPDTRTEDRVTKLNDNVNMTVNESAVELILAETRSITQAIMGFRSDFGNFSTRWTATNSEKSSDRYGNETVLSGD